MSATIILRDKNVNSYSPFEDSGWMRNLWLFASKLSESLLVFKRLDVPGICTVRVKQFFEKCKDQIPTELAPRSKFFFCISTNFFHCNRPRSLRGDKWMEIPASRSVSLLQSWTIQRDGGILADTISFISLLQHTKVATFVLIGWVSDVTSCSRKSIQVSALCAGIFELSNGGNPKPKLTIEKIGLPFGVLK